MKIISVFLLGLMLFACNMKQTQTPEKPSRESIVKAMTTGNDYFMNKFPDPGKDLIQPPNGIVWKSNIWTWGRENWFSPDEILESAGLLGSVMLREAQSPNAIRINN